jgi:hypothetical protein
MKKFLCQNSGEFEMFLLLSGEGASDIGTQDNEIGPMTKFVDNWVAQHIGYSLIDRNYYSIVTKQALSEVAKKELKPLSKRGKKNKPETHIPQMFREI